MESTLPMHLEPMLATLGTLPPAGADDKWGFEMKWDGVRALVRIDRGELSLRSRNNIDMTVAYPELQPLGGQLGDSRILLDGEIVSFDAKGRPSFGRLQKRMHISSATAAGRLAASEPAVLLVFDLLHLDDRSTLGLQYSQRRQLLGVLGEAAARTGHRHGHMVAGLCRSSHGGPDRSGCRPVLQVRRHQGPT